MIVWPEARERPETVRAVEGPETLTYNCCLWYRSKLETHGACLCAVTTMRAQLFLEVNPSE